MCIYMYMCVYLCLFIENNSNYSYNYFQVEHGEAEVRCGKYINMVLLVTKQGPL